MRRRRRRRRYYVDNLIMVDDILLVVVCSFVDDILIELLLRGEMQMVVLCIVVDVGFLVDVLLSGEGNNGSYIIVIGIIIVILSGISRLKGSFVLAFFGIASTSILCTQYSCLSRKRAII